MEVVKEKSFCPFDEDVLRLVRYECSCGMPQPLCRLYFCRHCLDVRCGFCVSHEVDSHYCPNCLENMPSAEARLKRNRCANCFDCPSCGHTLSTRATSIQKEASKEAATAKKVYYLACAFCRWTSRDIGLPDQNVASGGWPQPDSPGGARFALLQDHYRTLAQREKLEKETRRFCGRKLSYMQLTDKYGLSAAVARKRAGLPPLHSLTLAASKDEPSNVGSGGNVTVAPSGGKNVQDVEVLPAEIFTTPVDLCKVTRLEQRLAQVDSQPEMGSDVFPRHKHLMIKRSQRCRRCEHNLSKPEYNPTSIKFKIQLAAYYHVPEMVIWHVDKLREGQKVQFVLKLANPTQHPTNVEFVHIETFRVHKEKKKLQEEEQVKKEEEESKSSGDQPRPSMLRHPALVKAPAILCDVVPTAHLELPENRKVEVYLPPRDDAAEFDDSGPDLRGIVDDKQVVAWRKGNKAGVKLTATIKKGLEVGQEVVVAFALKFVYTNTVPAIEQREVQTADITVPAFVVLGNVIQ